MNAKKFSDALSALDGRYVEEAAGTGESTGSPFGSGGAPRRPACACWPPAGHC